MHPRLVSPYTYLSLATEYLTQHMLHPDDASGGDRVCIVEHVTLWYQHRIYEITHYVGIPYSRNLAILCRRNAPSRPVPDSLGFSFSVILAGG